MCDFHNSSDIKTAYISNTGCTLMYLFGFVLAWQVSSDTEAAKYADAWSNRCIGIKIDGIGGFASFDGVDGFDSTDDINGIDGGYWARTGPGYLFVYDGWLLIMIYYGFVMAQKDQIAIELITCSS